MAHRWRAPLLLLALSACSAPPAPADSAASSTVVLVSPGEARTHLTSSPEPAYPLLAQAAGISGAVYYEIDISPDGRVAAARLIHGSPMLEQGALDAVLRWRYSPFQADGHPVTARTIAALMFTGKPVTADTQAAIEQFAELMLPCADASRRRAFVDAETQCSAAIAAAGGLVSFDRTTDARPLRLHAEAMAAQGRHDEAIVEFEAVVARLRELPVFALDRTLALIDLGRSMTAVDRPADALNAYRQADRQLTEALRSSDRESPFSLEVIAHLREVLTEYASLMEADGRTADAQQIRTRLASLP